MKDVNNPTFKAFLKEAQKAYLAQAGVGKLNLADLTPWKTLGRKWHLSRKGFPCNKRVAWKVEVLQQLEKEYDKENIDYTRKTSIKFFG